MLLCLYRGNDIRQNAFMLNERMSGAKSAADSRKRNGEVLQKNFPTVAIPVEVILTPGHEQNAPTVLNGIDGLNDNEKSEMRTYRECSSMPLAVDGVLIVKATVGMF